MNYRSKTKSELAAEYNVSIKCFRNWLNNPYVLERFRQMHINYNAHIIPPRGVKFIYEHFGEP